jgi:hypothetical protein
MLLCLTLSGLALRHRLDDVLFLADPAVFSSLSARYVLRNALCCVLHDGLWISAVILSRLCPSIPNDSCNPGLCLQFALLP